MSNKSEFIEVECCYCSKKFNKTLHRYKEAIKNKWRFFCGRDCIKGFFSRESACSCSQCNKSILVKKSAYDKSENKRFFCNHKCSAKFNNKLRGARTELTKQRIKNGVKKHYDGKNKIKVKKTCIVCGKDFSGKIKNKFCCSRDCSFIHKFGSLPYTKEYVINTIIEMKKRTGLTPQMRDCEYKLIHAASRFFRTWNKTMVECGLKPNKSRYRKINLRCKDGHIVDSISEKLIDEWLFKNDIKHEKNKKYPNSNFNCDFYLSDYDLWVEYFGLYGGNISDYNASMEEKEKIVKKNGLKFISIKPEDLYGDKDKSYDVKINSIFADHF